MAADRAKAPPFPWDRMLAIGLGILRLSPESFWRMTPRELAAAMRGLFGEPEAPFDRSTLEQLARRYPDQPRNQSGDQPRKSS